MNGLRIRAGGGRAVGATERKRHARNACLTACVGPGKAPWWRPACRSVRGAGWTAGVRPWTNRRWRSPGLVRSEVGFAGAASSDPAASRILRLAGPAAIGQSTRALSCVAGNLGSPRPHRNFERQILNHEPLKSQQELFYIVWAECAADLTISIGGIGFLRRGKAPSRVRWPGLVALLLGKLRPCGL